MGEGHPPPFFRLQFATMLNFWLWVIGLTALLIYPVGKLIWVISVRRLQRKLQRELSDTEIEGQRSRAFFVSVFVSLVFSALYNLSTIGFPK